MGVLYRHIRLDTNEPFYIGISKNEKRPYDKIKRNRHWKFISSKCDIEVEIMLEHDDYDFLKEKEKEFIKLYGRSDIKTGTLCNMTDGGEGTLGCFHTDEFKKKVSEMNKSRVGEKNPNFGRKWDEEYKKKISVANSGKVRSHEHCLKLSIANKKTDKKPKILKGYRKGENHYAFGKKNIGLSNWAKNQKGEKHRKSKKIIDESTGIIYSCLREASEKTGINYSTLRSNLNGRRPNNTTFKLL